MNRIFKISDQIIPIDLISLFIYRYHLEILNLELQTKFFFLKCIIQNL